MDHLCQVCDKIFPNSSQLKAHSRTHSGEKPFDCTICQKSFSSSSSLKSHHLTHTGEQLFPCTDCNTSFSQSSNLKTHQITHSGLTPFGAKRLISSIFPWFHTSIYWIKNHSAAIVYWSARWTCNLETRARFPVAASAVVGYFSSRFLWREIVSQLLGWCREAIPGRKSASLRTLSKLPLHPNSFGKFELTFFKTLFPANQSFSKRINGRFHVKGPRKKVNVKKWIFFNELWKIMGQIDDCDRFLNNSCDLGVFLAKNKKIPKKDCFEKVKI